MRTPAANARRRYELASAQWASPRATVSGANARRRDELASAPWACHRATVSGRKLIQVLEVFQRTRVGQRVDVLHRQTVHDVSYGELRQLA